MDPQALVPDLLKLPPLAEPRPPPKYRSRFPAALKRAAEAVDEAQLRFAENPLQFEEAFEDAKQRFIDVYEAMSEEKKRALRHAAISVNMEGIWGDEARSRVYYRNSAPAERVCDLCSKVRVDACRCVCVFERWQQTYPLHFPLSCAR